MFACFKFPFVEKGGLMNSTKHLKKGCQPFSNTFLKVKTIVTLWNAFVWKQDIKILILKLVQDTEEKLQVSIIVEPKI